MCCGGWGVSEGFLRSSPRIISHLRVAEGLEQRVEFHSFFNHTRVVRRRHERDVRGRGQAGWCGNVGRREGAGKEFAASRPSRRTDVSQHNFYRLRFACSRLPGDQYRLLRAAVYDRLERTRRRGKNMRLQLVATARTVPRGGGRDCVCAHRLPPSLEERGRGRTAHRSPPSAPQSRIGSTLCGDPRCIDPASGTDSLRSLCSHCSRVAGDQGGWGVS